MTKESGKDVMIRYCANLRTNNLDYLQDAQENEGLLKKGDYKSLNGCPANYGLPEFDGLCIEESVYGWEAQSKQCNQCWLTAANLEVNVVAKEEKDIKFVIREINYNNDYDSEYKTIIGYADSEAKALSVIEYLENKKEKYHGDNWRKYPKFEIEPVNDAYNKMLLNLL